MTEINDFYRDKNSKNKDKKRNGLYNVDLENFIFKCTQCSQGFKLSENKSDSVVDIDIILQ